MADADTLWSAVKLAYEENILVGLTNPRKREGQGIDDDKGVSAAQAIIDLFPVHVQADFDITSGTHVQVAMEGVIAILWKRGGASTSAEKVKWEDWVALAQALKVAEPRAHAVPESTSALDNPPADEVGDIAWAHRRNFRWLLPRTRGQGGVYGGPEEWS